MFRTASMLAKGPFMGMEINFNFRIILSSFCKYLGEIFCDEIITDKS